MNTRIFVTVLVAAALLLGACAPRPPKAPEPVADADALYHLGERHVAENAESDALRVFNEYVARYPKGRYADAALMRMGAIHLGLKDYGSARSIYEHLISRYPRSPFLTEAQANLLEAYFHVGDTEGILRVFAAMDLERLPPNQQKTSHLLAGDARWIQSAWAAAAVHYAQAYLLAPADEKDAIRGKVRDALRQLPSGEMNTLVADAQPIEVRQLLVEIAGQYGYNPFRIGCLLPLSGRYAGFGQKALRGVELALAAFTERTGSTDHQILVRDTGGDDEKAVAAVRELADGQQVAALIGPIITAQAAATEAQRMGVPIVTMTQKEGIPDIGTFVFRNFFTPRMQVQSLITFCTQVLGLSRFAVLYPDESYGRTFMNAFWDALLQTGGTIVGAEAYDPETTDFAEPIKRLAPGQAVGPGPRPIVDFQALFIPDAPNKIGLILPQLAYHDITGVLLLGTNLWYAQTLLDLSRQYAQGAVFPMGFFPQSTSERVRAFVARFENIFGEPPEFFEAVAFDTTLMLLEAVSDPRVASRNDLKDLLHDFKGFSGVTGPASFDPNGEVLRTLQLVQIKGDRFVEIGPPMESPSPDAR